MRIKKGVRFFCPTCQKSGELSLLKKQKKPWICPKCGDAVQLIPQSFPSRIEKDK